MTREQLERKRDGVKAQIRWAALHRGDQELIDVLRDESSRLSMMLGRPKRTTSIDPAPDNAHAVRMEG
jgi:hypothetical protein